MAAPGFLFSLGRVTKMLGEDEELLRELDEDMDPEDGCIWVLGPDDESTLAFTQQGVESLQQLIEDRKSRR
jgi:hypothetical protein